MSKEKVVYGIYIKASAEKIWDALTKSEYTRQYVWGTNVESDWEVGSPFRAHFDDGTTFMEGEILKSERGKILSRKSAMILPDGTKGEESIITFEIEPAGEVNKLIVTHEDIPESFEDAMLGWEMCLSSLKSLLETGKALEIAG